MATDKRELLLLRLQAVLLLPGITTVYRDRGDFPDEKLPAVILLDGTERRKQGGESRRGQPSASVMTLEPQIFLIESAKSLKDASLYGPLISQWRMKVLGSIIKDPQLLALVGFNGGIEYRGMDTDMQSGRSMAGQLQFFFAFDYVLNPNDL